MKEKWQNLPMYGKIAIGAALVAVVIIVVRKVRKKS